MSPIGDTLDVPYVQRLDKFDLHCSSRKINVIENMSNYKTQKSPIGDMLRAEDMDEKLIQQLIDQNAELVERNSRLTDSLNVVSEDLQAERAASSRRKNKVTGGYYMMSRKAEKNMRELAKDNPTASLVFSVIREHMQIGTNAVTISNAAFAQILGKSTKTISRATKYLADKKYVQVIKVGTGNSYVVNETIAFSGTPQQRMAVFSSTVVAHESENEGWEKVDKLKACPIIREGERALIGSDELPPPDQQDLDLN